MLIDPGPVHPDPPRRELEESNKELSPGRGARLGRSLGYSPTHSSRIHLTRRKLEPGAYGGVEYEPASDSTGQSQRLSGESIEREYRGGAFRLRSGFVQA